MYSVIVSASPDGTVTASVCAWCQPRRTVFYLYPELRGVKLTHGICKDCARCLVAQEAAKESQKYS